MRFSLAPPEKLISRPAAASPEKALTPPVASFHRFRDYLFETSNRREPPTGSPR